MTFDEALEELMQGKRVRRSGWNDYLYKSTDVGFRGVAGGVISEPILIKVSAQGVENIWWKANAEEKAATDWEIAVAQ